MTRYDDGIKSDEPADSRDRKHPIALAECNGAGIGFLENLFRRRRRDLLDGGAGPPGAGNEAGDHVRADGDEGPVFGGGDEDSLDHLGDTGGPGGGVGDSETCGGVDRGGQSLIGAEPAHFFDDGLQWGKRRNDECSLSFMDGDDCVILLGDGEDLP